MRWSGWSLERPVAGAPPSAALERIGRLRLLLDRPRPGWVLRLRNQRRPHRLSDETVQHGRARWRDRTQLGPDTSSLWLGERRSGRLCGRSLLPFASVE